jgi:hypothetical protein
MPTFCETNSEETSSAKSTGEKWEGIAFTFCKASSIVLLITLLRGSRYMLPIVAGATCLLYLFTYFKGKKETRCILSHPLLAAVFWAMISGVSLWFTLR